MKTVIRMGVLAAILISVFAAFCFAQESDSTSSSRSGLYFGAGIGRGSMNIKFSGDIDNRVSEDGPGFNYRFGYAVNDMIHIGMDMDLLVYYNHSRLNTFAGYSFVVNYYINDLLFIKAGPSLTAVEGEPTGSEESLTGFGITAGAGLDIRIFSRLAFTPIYSFYYNTTSGVVTKYQVIALGGTYYFK
jgi:hypothetical protein